MTDKAAIFERRRQQKLSPGDEIRAQLKQIEASLAQMKTINRDRVIELLEGLDHVHDLMTRFDDLPLQAETARFVAVQHAVERRAASLLRVLGGTQSLEAERERRSPEPSQRWWYLDQIVEEKRKTLLRQVGISVAVATAITLALTGVYKAFFEPDEATKQTVRHSLQANDLIYQGELPAALEEVEAALLYSPEDLELLVLKSVLLEQLDEPDKAEAAAEQARAASPNEEQFLIERGFAYLDLQQPESALADAESVLAINPESVEGYFILGISHDYLEDYASALEALEKASTLAEEQGKDTLMATIRVRTAEILQKQSYVVPTVIPD
ncbi:MAG: tetratricopeptide repeat protein [Anaerolineae bacterium]|nr:tetratricopeptide repeat protein [Anaerolineae bacterium]